MGPNYTHKFLHSKGNHKQNSDLQTGGNLRKQCGQQGLNYQNIQTAHTAQ